MADRRSVNRSMFWRVIRRSMFADRGRLFVILLALGAGAAITAALLNLQVDAERRITTEFRSFGANVLISPKKAERLKSIQPPRDLLQSRPLPNMVTGQLVSAVSFLYLVGRVSVEKEEQPATSGNSIPVVVGGFSGDALSSVMPFSVQGTSSVKIDQRTELPCVVGISVANRLKAEPNSRLRIEKDGRKTYCLVSTVANFGAPEDNQVFVPISETQYLAKSTGEIGLIAARVSGSPMQMDQWVEALQRAFPETEVRPIRQFTEGEARLYTRISGILTATVAVVLILTALCVMAAMTNVAMERKNDVGLMKAIGGSVRRVLRLFLAEAALLGLAGGLIGAAVGIVISIGLGKALFGVAAQPRLIVYPISVALTILVAILAAYPLRRLVHIRPASVFRGEE